MDPLTGLPELPENQRWSVEHPRMEFSIATYTGGFPLADESRLKVTLQKRVERKVTKTRWLFKFSGTEEHWVNVESADCRGTSPVAVLNAANRIMKNREKLAGVASLVGVYPPKRLEIK